MYVCKYVCIHEWVRIHQGMYVCMYVCMYCMCAVNLVNFLVRMHSGQEVFLGSRGIHVPVVVILQLQVVVSIQHLMFMQIHMYVCIFVLCFLHVYIYVCMYV
jgi:hypothetical protein